MGNITIAWFLMSQMYSKAQYGFNKLHYHALMEDKEIPIEIKKISVKWASLEGITPVHLAAINPNPWILEQLLNCIEDDKSLLDLIMESGDNTGRIPTHYAAACSNS